MNKLLRKSYCKINNSFITFSKDLHEHKGECIISLRAKCNVFAVSSENLHLQLRKEHFCGQMYFSHQEIALNVEATSPAIRRPH